MKSRCAPSAKCYSFSGYLWINVVVEAMSDVFRLRFRSCVKVCKFTKCSEEAISTNITPVKASSLMSMMFHAFGL